MKTIGLATLALFAMAGGAQAADGKINCKSQELTQYELDQCAGMDFTAADAKLNALYKTLMSKYDAPNQALLKSAQRAWLGFRDAECDYEANGTAGGTINPMENTICRTAKTNDRIKELTRQLHCDMEQDMTCNPTTK